MLERLKGHNLEALQKALKYIDADELLSLERALDLRFDKYTAPFLSILRKLIIKEIWLKNLLSKTGDGTFGESFQSRNDSWNNPWNGWFNIELGSSNWMKFKDPFDKDGFLTPPALKLRIKTANRGW